MRIATFAVVALHCMSLPIGTNDDRPEIIEIIAPASVAQETLNSLNLGDTNAEGSDRSKRTIGVLRELFPNLSQITATADNGDSENQLAGAESQQSEVRVQFSDPEGNQGADNQAESDQEGAASDNDGLALDDIDSPDENRDKRFLGGGDSSGGSSSGGGSGNFLFDIIRLVAGSGGTDSTDESSNATADGDSDSTGKTADNTYGEGIPGPVTRLFIIANRGISNLIQDLILRLAQTSERIVNFKARLITSII